MLHSLECLATKKLTIHEVLLSGFLGAALVEAVHVLDGLSEAVHIVAHHRVQSVQLEIVS